MAKSSSKTKTSRVTGELADLTGRSNAEIKLMAGVALAGVGVAVTLRTVKFFVDLGPTPPGPRGVHT